MCRVETVDVRTCKFGICGIKKIKENDKKKQFNMTCTKYCVVFVFCK